MPFAVIVHRNGGDEPESTALRLIDLVGRSVIVLSLLPLAQRARGLPRSRKKETQHERDQSLASPCCHFAALQTKLTHHDRPSRNGIIALEIARASPSWPAMMALIGQRRHQVVALTGRPRLAPDQLEVGE